MAVKALSTGQTFLQFSCVSCHKQRHEYLIDQIVTNENIRIQKYGELPRKNLDRDIQLQKFFSNDSDCYEKAIVCLANGYGIGAFAYMRRIVERNILNLLDMLREDIESLEDNEKIKEALSELRKESPMSQKITVANNALPEYLKPNGLNPLGKLYQILSGGVHSFSDEECLKKANAVNECIKYLISELSSRKKNRNRFKGLISSL